MLLKSCPALAGPGMTFIQEYRMYNLASAFPPMYTAATAALYIASSQAGITVDNSTSVDVNVVLLISFLAGVIVVTRQTTRLLDRLKALEDREAERQRQKRVE
jgi:hypothetical protein